MDYLKKHQVLHSNDTKWSCGDCGELCGSLDGLKKHRAHHHKPNLELNSFEDLALQLPGLEMESIHESIQAVSIDGVKKLYAERSNLLEVPVICPWSETNCARNHSCNVQHILSFLICIRIVVIYHN